MRQKQDTTPTWTARTKGPSLRPSTFVSGRDWRRELKEYSRLGKADAHRGVDGFPAYLRRALRLYAAWAGREFGETASFTVARGAAILLANAHVDIIRDSVEPILQHGTPEEQDTLERFKYQVDAKDGARRLDVHLTEEEIKTVSRLIEILGLQIQTVLALACVHVLREVPAVRADWRLRMAMECKQFQTRLVERANSARETAAKYTRAKGRRRLS